MKKNLTLILFGFLPLFAFSQIQQAFNYQAAIRNAGGKIQFDTTVSFKIEILQNGIVEYSENHFNKETGKTGVVNFKVGNGEVIDGDFSEINWSQGQLQIRTTLDGELNPIGIADIVAIPIALFAQSSGGDNDWTINNQDIFRLNGRVGIGINSPSRLLHLKGGAGTSIIARIESQNTNGSTIDFRDPNTTGDWLARIGGKGDGLTFIAGGIERMNIHSNGYTGIGVDSP